MRQFLLIVLSIGLSIAPANADEHFSNYPAGALYTGPVPPLRFKEKSDKSFKALIEDAMKAGPNFAGKYRLVRFRTGNGPIKVVVVDMKSGMVFRLPPDVVEDGLYIYDAPCLELYKRWQKGFADGEGDFLPLSYSPASELLVVKRCNYSRAEESYFRLHNSKWDFIERVSRPPPPPIPVYTNASVTTSPVTIVGRSDRPLCRNVTSR